MAVVGRVAGLISECNIKENLSFNKDFMGCLICVKYISGYGDTTVTQINKALPLMGLTFYLNEKENKQLKE